MYCVLGRYGELNIVGGSIVAHPIRVGVRGGVEGGLGGMGGAYLGLGSMGGAYS